MVSHGWKPVVCGEVVKCEFVNLWEERGRVSGSKNMFGIHVRGEREGRNKAVGCVDRACDLVSEGGYLRPEVLLFLNDVAGEVSLVVFRLRELMALFTAV